MLGAWPRCAVHAASVPPAPPKCVRVVEQFSPDRSRPVVLSPGPNEASPPARARVLWPPAVGASRVERRFSPTSPARIREPPARVASATPASNKMRSLTKTRRLRLDGRSSATSLVSTGRTLAPCRPAADAGAPGLPGAEAKRSSGSYPPSTASGTLALTGRRTAFA